jgi:two-component system, NtrC family, response regulator AtoC
MSAADLAGPTFHILVGEDEPEIRDYLQLALRRPNLVVDFAEDGEEVLNALTRSADTPALLILDVMMPRRDGISTLKEIRDRKLTLPIIMLSGFSSADCIAEALENGANNFLTKPISHEKLHEAVDLLLPSNPATSALSRGPGSVGKPALKLAMGDWIRKVDPVLKRVAACDVPILLQGETGVGKEVLARHIHSQSLRSGKVFLKINCAALPPELVESELFGYERGAFTGAYKSTPGKFELADGGTILLDEIGDMDLRLQAKLLQVLQDREFHRIGAKESTQVDVRVIAATHRDLETQVDHGEFREDLFYRLNVFNFAIPPLRERMDEIVPLAAFFLSKHSPAGSVPELGSALRRALLHHTWPGNIRELENIMRKYLVVRSPEIIIDDLQQRSARRVGANRRLGLKTAPVAHARPPLDDASSDADSSAERGVFSQACAEAGGSSLEGDGGADNSELAKVDQARRTAETEVILKALHSTQWNRKRSAVLLGIDYKALLYKMKKLGID